MLKGFVGSALAGLMFFAVSPTSTNYILPSYDIGSGGTDNSSSSNYRLNGTTGTQTGDPQTSTNFSLTGGANPTQNANVPPAPVLTNPADYYNQLKLVVNEGANASDTKYLIAISSDGFTTTKYIQTDNSLGSGYTLGSYRSYVSYGSASGFQILGLTPSTTYQVRVRALKGAFTETGFGPATSGVATVAQSLSLGLTTTLTAVPPFLAGFSSLSPGSVFNADADINIDLTTNALSGGTIYIQSLNAGLTSVSAGFTIASATADLALATDGFGAQVISATQSSGGPISGQAPFNGSGDNVGVLLTALQPLITSPGAVTGASATIRLKARATSDTTSAYDYSDSLSIVAAMNY